MFVKDKSNILKAMQGIRIFDRFGFNLPKASNALRVNSKVVKEDKECTFDAAQFAWINIKSYDTLTKYTPASQLLEILNNRANTVKE